jgi:hypothetical protein
MGVPMNVPNRPTATLKFFEWYYAVGKYSDTARQMMVAEEALSYCCKAMDTLGQIYIDEFRTDCAACMIKRNKKFQLFLNEHQFLDLFLGGILKLDKLNMAWQSKSVPSRKPRLKGVFRGESMVSDTITELVDFGLRKLTRDLVDRGQTIFGEIPIMFACAENAAASPTPSSNDCSSRGAQLEMRLPPAPANVTQGTMLQLGGYGSGGGWPHSAMAQQSHYGPQGNYDGRRSAEFSRDESRVRAKHRQDDLPPGPRQAGILTTSELLHRLHGAL